MDQNVFAPPTASLEPGGRSAVLPVEWPLGRRKVPGYSAGWLYGTWRQAFPLALVCALPVVAVQLWLNAWLAAASPGEAEFGAILSFFVEVASTALFVPSVFYALVRRVQRRPSTLTECLRFGLGRYKRALGSRLAQQLLAAMGLGLLIVPGVYIYARLALIDAVVLFEPGQPVLKRAMALTRGQAWRVFAALFETIIFPALAIGCLGIIARFLSHPVVTVGAVLLTQILRAYVPLGMLALYVSLREERAARGEEAPLTLPEDLVVA